MLTPVKLVEMQMMMVIYFSFKKGQARILSKRKKNSTQRQEKSRARNWTAVTTKGRPAGRIAIQYICVHITFSFAPALIISNNSDKTPLQLIRTKDRFPFSGIIVFLLKWMYPSMATSPVEVETTCDTSLGRLGGIERNSVTGLPLLL